MKGLVAVARREFAEHRMILVAALASGALAALIPVLQSRGAAARETRELALSFVGVSFAAGVALALGSSTLAGQLANRRLGFYFARPLSGGEIWGGKFAGAALLVLAAEAAGALPGLAVNAGPPSRETLVLLWASLLFCVSVLLPLAHAIGIAARSRSRWLALDFAALTVSMILSTVAARLLIRDLAIDALNRGLALLGLAAVGGLVASGFAAISRGRTDVERAHRTLSLVLWGVAAGASVLFLAFALRTVSPRIGELTSIRGAVPGPRTPWVYAAGHTRGRGDLVAEFLFDTATGRAVRVRNGGRPVLFSSDGRLAVWCEPHYAARGFALLSRPWGAIRADGCRVTALDLRAPAAAARKTGIAPSTVPWFRALSPDGSRLALATSERGVRTLSVYEIGSGAVVAAATLPAAELVHIVFHGASKLLIYVDLRSGGRPGGIQVIEFDLAARRIEEIGRIAPDNVFRFVRSSPDRSRLLVISTRGIQLAGAAGDRPAALSSGPHRSRNAVFLEDGRVAVAEGDASGTRVRLFSPDGVEQKTIRIGPPGRLTLGAEARPGTLVLARRGDEDSGREGEAFAVDLASGGLRPLGARLTPAATAMAWLGDDPTYRLPAGDPGASLFLDSRSGTLVRVNLGTGQRRQILPTS